MKEIIIFCFKFVFDHTKIPEIYYKNNLVHIFVIFKPEILHLKMIKMIETPCSSLMVLLIVQMVIGLIGLSGILVVQHVEKAINQE
jgi:hypothetical protein